MLNYIGNIKSFKLHGLPLWRRVEHFVCLSTDFIIFNYFEWRSM